jgi:hypothetical protein
MSDGHIGNTEGEFSVCQFFKDDSYEYVRRYVSAEEAVEAAKHYTTSVGARFGTTKRVIVTDGGDYTNFEWKFGEGITYPPKDGTQQNPENTSKQTVDRPD